MDDKATAAKIIDDHYESGRNFMYAAIVAALEAARREGVTSVHDDNNRARVYERCNLVNEARSCGGIIDCTGDVPCVRRVLGSLPVTADGAVVATGGVVYFIAFGGTCLMHATAGDVRKGWVRSPECWADESAAKAAMEGGKA